MKKHYKTQLGFSLIELMTVLAILGIIVAIAAPQYRQYVMQSERINAISELQRIDALQQRFRMQNNIYANSLAQLGYTLNAGAVDITSGDGSVIYQMTMDPAIVNGSNGQRYTAVINAVNAQANDDCTQFTLDSRGAKGAASSSIAAPDEAVQACWQ